MATALGRKSQGNKREIRHCHNGSHHSHNLCKSHKRATHRRQDGPGKQNSNYDTQAKSDMEGGQQKVPNTQDVLHILGINISNSCAFPPLIWSGWGDTPAPPRHQHCVSKLIRSGTPPYTPFLILKKPIYLNMPIFPFQPQHDGIFVSPKADKSIQFSVSRDAHNPHFLRRNSTPLYSWYVLHKLLRVFHRDFLTKSQT